MAEKNSTLLKTSRYVAGGQTEVNSERLEWWERTIFPLDASDQIFTIDKTTEGRLDLIAHAFLSDSNLWWVIAQYNAILDPFGEITIGRTLRIPTPARIQNMLTGKLGGYESKREVPLANITPIV
jgi:hypothetical protein